MSAFDRPQAVIVMGPRPLPVTFVGGLPSGPPAPKEPKEPKESSFVSRLTDGLRFAGQVATGAGQAAAGVAHNSPAAVFNGAVNTAAAGLNRLGPYGQAAAAGLQAASAGVNAFREAVGAFTNRAKEIGGYDGRIAGANAMAEVRRINSDMREANKIGDQLSKLVTAQSKTEAMWDEILTIVKGPLIEVLTSGLDLANSTSIGVLEGLRKLIPGRTPKLDSLIEKLIAIQTGDPGTDLDARIREFINTPLGGYVAPAPASASSGGMPPLGMPIFN